MGTYPIFRQGEKWGTSPFFFQSPELLRRLLRAKDRMDAASHEEWPVSRLAEVSCVSEAHFARSFKEAFGLPPHRYVLQRRLRRARELLQHSALPLGEIALACGFASASHFSNRFRQTFGAAPGLLRAARQS